MNLQSENNLISDSRRQSERDDMEDERTATKPKPKPKPKPLSKPNPAPDASTADSKVVNDDDEEAEIGALGVFLSVWTTFRLRQRTPSRSL